MNPAGPPAYGPLAVTALVSFPAAPAEAGALDVMIEGTPSPCSHTPLKNNLFFFPFTSIQKIYHTAVAMEEVSTPETTSMSRV